MTLPGEDVLVLGAGPAGLTAALHLVLRGYYLASVEDPERWTSERVSPIVKELVALLRGPTS